MALSKVDFNNINVTPAASKALKWNSSANGFETGDLVGSMVLLSTITSSNSATTSFTSSLDSTYSSYLFVYINFQPVSGSNDKRFTLQASTNGGSSYGVTATTTAFRATHDEDDGSAALGYTASHDIAQSTDFFQISDILADDGDCNISGHLQLFNPASTTFVKHFIGRFQGSNDAECISGFGAGYFNTTSAINAIQFKLDSGNHNGTIKMYGIL